MNNDELEIAEKMFLDEEMAYYMINSYFDTVVFPNKPGSIDGQNQELIVRQVYKESLDIVFKFAESPIEKIFLNALLLQNVMYGPYLIKYTEPYYAVNQQIRNLRAGYEQVIQLWQGFQELNGKDEDGGEFIEFVLNASNFTTEDKNFILHHMLLMYGLKHINVVHISLQCILDDVTVNGKHIRPDMFVWIPSRPEFKLIVECDDFKYHSSKEAFTNDRESDRILQSKGYQVLRFSGEEILNNSVSKAEELHSYLITIQKEKFREEIMDDFPSLKM